MRRGEYYAIRSMLPELSGGKRESNALKKEYSSADAVISYAATVKLLREHRLMVPDAPLPDAEELLR